MKNDTSKNLGIITACGSAYNLLDFVLNMGSLAAEPIEKVIALVSGVVIIAALKGMFDRFRTTPV